MAQDPATPLIPRLGLGGLCAAEVRGEAEQALWFSLRSRVFRGGRGDDRDPFDGAARAVLIRAPDGAPVAGFRIRHFATGAETGASYTALSYDLRPLARIRRPVAELGRVAILPGAPGAPLLRLLLACLTHIVEEGRIALLFGASSLPGADAARHAGALAALRATALGPEALRPRARQPIALPGAEPQAADLPPLLRAYLAAGAWVGEDAVADPDLDTLHVFTALEPARVPPARARALRALARAAVIAT